MKLTQEAYNLIIEELTEICNGLEPDDERRIEIEEAMDELDTTGTY